MFLREGCLRVKTSGYATQGDQVYSTTGQYQSLLDLDPNGKWMQYVHHFSPLAFIKMGSLDLGSIGLGMRELVLIWVYVFYLNYGFLVH